MSEQAKGRSARGGSAGRRAGDDLRAYPASVERLIAEFSRLPGVGRRGAERFAFWVLRADGPTALGLADAIGQVKGSVRHCAVCFNLTETDPCPICADGKRDRGLVLVVEQPRDLLALEQTGAHQGVYHALLGRLSPLEGIGPEDLTVAALMKRIEEPGANAGGAPVREVILGLNPTLEGDGTALYLADEIRKRGVAVSRLARGLTPGGSLEHSSRASLSDAIEGRRPMTA